jgi:hypothetical protein
LDSNRSVVEFVMLSSLQFQYDRYSVVRQMEKKHLSFVIVSSETMGNNNNKKPRIPDALLI